MLNNGQRELLVRVRSVENKIHESSQELEALVSTFGKRFADAGYDIAQFKGDLDILNDLGVFFLRRGMHSQAEILYWFMLDTINTQERKHGRLHKGLPLHNIGVAQIQQRNFDEGIPNILAASDEDVLTLGRKKAKNELAYKLARGFIGYVATELDKAYMPIVKPYAIKHGFSGATASDLLNMITEDRRLLLARIFNSKIRLKFRNDVYTRVILLDNLKNLCLLLEVELRARTSTGKLLHEFIKNEFRHLAWSKYFIIEVNKPRKSRLTYFDNVKDLETKYTKVMSTRFSKAPDENFVVKCFLLCCLVRNFTSHEFANVSFLKNAKNYDTAFSTIVAALLYALNRYA